MATKPGHEPEGQRGDQAVGVTDQVRTVPSVDALTANELSGANAKPVTGAV